MKKGQILKDRPRTIGVGIRISKDMHGSVQIISDDSGDSKNKVFQNLIEFSLFYVYRYGYKSLKNKMSKK